MSRPRLTVVLSQAQGKNPAKRALEESVAAALILDVVDGDVANHMPAGLAAIDADVDGFADVARGIDDQPGARALVNDDIRG